MFGKDSDVILEKSGGYCNLCRDNTKKERQTEASVGGGRKGNGREKRGEGGLSRAGRRGIYTGVSSFCLTTCERSEEPNNSLAANLLRPPSWPIDFPH